jgi:hypothetical protein
MRPAALQALADAAEALARLAREAASDPDGKHQDDPLVPLAEAARLAATSVRVVRDAIRNRQLAAFGRRRDRAVRRGDLDAWIASRQMTPIEGVDDADIERRVARLARATPTPNPTPERTRVARPRIAARTLGTASADGVNAQPSWYVSRKGSE